MTATEQEVLSPQITHISWGQITVEGVGSGRDYKVYPGEGREWDWSETDTHHNPGIQPADVQELLDRGSKVIVLSRGMHLVLRTCPETLAMLEELGIPVFVEETNAAVARYNLLVDQGEPVGALIHSTC